MSFSLIPEYSFEKLTDISPKFLLSIGVRLLLLDLDNTISPYGEQNPTSQIIDWTKTMADGGVKLFIVSNTKKPRAGQFAKKMGVPYLQNARKPSRKGLIEAMKISGCTKKETALAGDQIFTDILAANRAGVASLLVEPIKFTNIFLALRYYVEKPFRILARNNRRRKYE